jgi:prepilin-type N-terminal cleavage/methylation domain-containing protein
MPTKEYGFSLIELMVAVIIMGTLVMLAAPSYSTYLNSQSVRNASESLVAGLQIARAEAIRSNATTVFQVVDSLTDACKVNPAGRYWVVSHCSAESACAQNIDKQSAPPTVCSDTAVILAKGSFDANDRVLRPQKSYFK